MAIQFPSTVGQPTDGSFNFIASNGITYYWYGTTWDSNFNPNTSADARYVLKSGDTMTGSLTVPTLITS